MSCKKTNRAVCVLGMHRSGTSTITRAINLMGVYLGEELLPPADDNPKGFWENIKILNLHEKILESLGTSWDDIHRIDPTLCKSHILASYKEELISLIHSEFDSSQIWGWKDPRTCLLLPLWIETLTELNIPVNFIITIRNPLEVARSLSKRNGFSMEKGFLLWYKYTFLALKNSQGFPRVIVNYDTFVSNWRTDLIYLSSKLNIALPNDFDQFESDLNTFITPSLRHNKVTQKDDIQNLPEPIQKLYTDLSDCTEVDNKLNKEIWSLSELSSLISNYYDQEEKTKFRINYEINDKKCSEEEEIYSFSEKKLEFVIKESGLLRISICPVEHPAIFNININIISNFKHIIYQLDETNLSDCEFKEKPVLNGLKVIKKDKLGYLLSFGNNSNIELPPIFVDELTTIVISLNIETLLTKKEVSIIQEIEESHGQTILTLNNRYNNIKTELEVMHKEKEDLTKQLNILEQKLSEAERKKADLADVNSAFENSSSWKITSPLRFVGRIGRKLVDKKH